MYLRRQIMLVESAGPSDPGVLASSLAALQTFQYDGAALGPPRAVALAARGVAPARSIPCLLI